ncbi:GNAT family N-acetyltransferase [Amycolatopsis acidiphila]|uniref:GNAT family N-acetyltransferase n=1 Tax=Amycolatopsis acidiphila TaxID=715473 RepID=A0A558AD27_9PSEU|nr:GNAT family N-acetyltransferase [Amycolatopsis acidiphila]TVT22170.1 GNAT family N-acetyltransferase [Amycolatopsis acidiphila]UIJ61633.1 GNAT family N-acetyltransferase [Amycolatopsis acidiphila]GHG58773.1 N-acetyltransferase [Amycolatopsis acidiphila]
MNRTWRAVTVDDAEAIADLLEAAEAVEPTNEHYSAEDIRDELTVPNVRLADGSVSVWDGPRLVGYAMAVPREAANPEHRMRVELAVHPEYRDVELGKQLLEWQERTAQALHAKTFPNARLELHARVYESQQWYASVLQAAGFAMARSFATMRAELEKLPPRPELPPSLRLVGYEPAYEDPTREAVNDAFSGHWGMTPYSPELWRHRMIDGPAFRPRTSFLLLTEDGEVGSFVLSAFYQAEMEVTGVREVLIAYVGTRSALRGHGVATALLAHTLVAARDQGYERAALEVDESNAHNALDIYRRCGFEVTQRVHAWVRPMP